MWYTTWIDWLARAKTIRNAGTRCALCRPIRGRRLSPALTEPPRKVFVDAFFANDSSPADALKRTVILALKSPRFLYPDLHSPEPDAHQIAARLALLLWDSVPDRSLQVAIQSGNLKTPNHVRAQANRMMRDPRARAKLQHFFQHWLELDKANAIDKNTEAFPNLTSTL